MVCTFFRGGPSGAEVKTQSPCKVSSAVGAETTSISTGLKRKGFLTHIASPVPRKHHNRNLRGLGGLLACLLASYTDGELLLRPCCPCDQRLLLGVDGPFRCMLSNDLHYADIKCLWHAENSRPQYLLHPDVLLMSTLKLIWKRVRQSAPRSLRLCLRRCFGRRGYNAIFYGILGA